MAKSYLPTPALILSKDEARRLMLSHHKLWPPRQLRGKAGIKEYIGHVGCIQFDPISKAGRNPDLVLQSRVKDYRPELLVELLYEERELLDGWDKLASIYLTSDWPYFERLRDRMRDKHDDPTNPAVKIAPDVLEAIRSLGPKSSIDLKHDQTIDWSWGQAASLARAALEKLFDMGELVIHHRVGTRRVFELTERALPDELLAVPDPNLNQEAYFDWHVKRRVQALGLANPIGTDHWLGIIGMNSPARHAALSRLVENGELAAIAIEDNPNRTLFMPPKSLESLNSQKPVQSTKLGAAVIAALDNMIWDRKMLSWLFDFSYTWEIYVPAAKRRYGYYVLPVLYGDNFIGRFEPIFDHESKTLLINNWWREDGLQLNDDMESALIECMQDFVHYLQAQSLKLASPVKKIKDLSWLSAAKIGI